MREFRVLVETVRRPVCGISDLVITISSGNARNVRRRHFAAVVVAEGVGVTACRAAERVVGGTSHRAEGVGVDDAVAEEAVDIGFGCVGG